MHSKYIILSSALILLLLAAGVQALIQTDIVYNMDDTYVNSSSADTNYDGSALRTQGSSSEIWLRFDLSDPSGYYVVGAGLWAYAFSVNGNEQYNIHQADSTGFTETNITWNNKPAYGANLDSEQISAAGWYNWAITGTYSTAFKTGSQYGGYAIEGPDSIVFEDKENTLSTGNVPYLNLTMMIPEVYLLSPADDISTYNPVQTFQYNTTDVGNITNCSLVLDGGINTTNSTPPKNTSSTFIPSALFPGIHTWTVRCFDVNRQTYQIEPAVRDLTILASVEWYNPSSAISLDVGAAIINAAEPTGTRQIYANNTNENVQVSCASGDCGVVNLNWSTSDVDGGEAPSIEFNCLTDVAGSYQADFELESDQDASADTLTVNCTILAPDLRINSTNITFSDNTPTENQEIDITAGVYNDGTYSATDFVVRFYNGHYSSGIQIGSDQTLTLAPGEYATVTQNWTTSVGSHDIYAVVDPPVDTNGSIAEIDETNNYAYSTIDISLWTYFVGNVTGTLALQTEDNKTVLQWHVADTTDSLVYVTDTDSNPDFNSLIALGRNTTGSYMSDDFVEFDNALNTTAYPDSVNLTFTSGGNPIDSQTFTVFGVAIDYVPVVESTNSSTFITGILWDSDDDSNNNHQFDNTSKEDVVFVTRVNQSKVGMYGTYDYEIRVPSKLKDYNGPDTQTVVFYTEIK